MQPIQSTLANFLAARIVRQLGRSLCRRSSSRRSPFLGPCRRSSPFRRSPCRRSSSPPVPCSAIARSPVQVTQGGLIHRREKHAACLFAEHPSDFGRKSIAVLDPQKDAFADAQVLGNLDAEASA